MIYATMPVTILYYCLFLIYYRSVVGAKRKSISSLVFVLLIIASAYLVLGYYNINAFSLPVILPLTIIAVKIAMGIDFLKSAFGAVTCVLGAYCARGIVAAVLSFVFLRTNPGYISELSSYLTATVIGLPIMLLTFQILRKTFFSDDKMREFLLENHYIIIIVGYGFVAAANFTLINLGRVSTQNEVWYIAIALGACLLTIGMLIVSTYYCIKINHLNEFETKNRVITAQLEKQKQYYLSYQKQQSKYMAFMHDYNAIINTLKTLIAKNNTQEAKKLMNSLDKRVKDNANTNWVYTKNAVLDSMLFDLQTVCEQNQIKFSFSGGAPIGTQLELTDAIRIFANLTTNAVEANLKVNERKRYIDIKSSNNANWAIIEVSNPYLEIVYKANKLSTTKRKKDEHGFGLENVKRITEAYNGFVIIDDLNKNFKVTVHIPKHEQKNFKNKKHNAL